MQRTVRFVVLGVLAAIGAGIPSVGHSQGYPNQPVKIIVPYPPGGGSDLMARMLGEKLHEKLGKPFIVENRTGASGNVGLEAAARATPDGYTIVINPNSISSTPALLGSSLDPVRDFAPIVMVSEAPIVIGGHPSIPVKTINEFVAYAKANAGKLSYASCGTGGLQHIAMEALKSRAGIDITHIPYNGCGRPLPDMLSGRVQFYVSVMNSVGGSVENGQLRAYAVSNANRSALMPAVPTVAESGFSAFAVDNWIGIFAPTGVPAEVVTKLNREINDVLRLPEIRQKMAMQLIEPVGGPSEKLGEAVKSDVLRYARILNEVGIEKFK